MNEGMCEIVEGWLGCDSHMTKCMMSDTFPGGISIYICNDGCLNTEIRGFYLTTKNTLVHMSPGITLWQTCVSRL